MTPLKDRHHYELGSGLPPGLIDIHVPILPATPIIRDPLFLVPLGFPNFSEEPLPIPPHVNTLGKPHEYRSLMGDHHHLAPPSPFAIFSIRFHCDVQTGHPEEGQHLENVMNRHVVNYVTFALSYVAVGGRWSVVLTSRDPLVSVTRTVGSTCSRVAYSTLPISNNRQSHPQPSPQRSSHLPSLLPRTISHSPARSALPSPSPLPRTEAEKKSPESVSSKNVTRPEPYLPHPSPAFGKNHSGGLTVSGFSVPVRYAFA